LLRWQSHKTKIYTHKPTVCLSKRRADIHQ